MLNTNLGKPWTTHMGILVRVLHMSEGGVVELGTGPFSTPLLHWVCKDMHRKLISYENDPEYYQYARQFRSHLHKIVFVDNWDEIDVNSHRGLVLVDHHPITRRGLEAIRFKESADFIIMHDTEYPKYYPGVEKHFKYIYIWRECRPWVTIASNFKDLSSMR